MGESSHWPLAQRNMIPDKIAVVGTGNVASHIAEALGRRIGIAISRDADRARLFAYKYGISRAGVYSDIISAAPDMVIVSIADHALPDVASAIGYIPGDPLVVHTSGTIPKEALSPMSKRTGVLYPLQTFSRDINVDMHTVPFFTEAEDVDDLNIIDRVAMSISDTVRHADAAQRQVLHIAGVFSSNFVNILLEMVQDILAGADYPLSTVRPLVEATVAKAFSSDPHTAQTGPARRGDLDVMRKHAYALPSDKSRIYQILSEYIMNSHKVTPQ